MSIKVIYDPDFKVAYFQDITEAELFAQEKGTNLIVVSAKAKSGSFGKYASKKGQVA